MKRVICLIIATLLFIVIPTQAFATESEATTLKEPTVLLSSLSREAQLSFLKEKGIDVPNYAEDYIIKLICHIEKDPTYPVAINNPVVFKIGEKVREAVNEYYGKATITEQTKTPKALTYTLQDSTVYGSWNNAFLNYNCYAYALIRTDDFYWPGAFSTVPDEDDFDITRSIYNMACDVRSDLKSSQLNKKCVKITTTRPSSASNGQTCICIRKGTEDFHFMRLISSYWYHKPGNTHILKYNYLPSTGREWTNECSFFGTAYEGDTTYDSAIYYILYKANHGTTVTTYTGNNYHSGNYHYYQYGEKCPDCGEYLSYSWVKLPCSGPPCPTPNAIEPVPEEV